ncbi:TetR/AcrR family transcriptional regulator [Pseudonocardia spinosispora]|uniref:TetR/AcrR family transcriptional regulator n=1 Tax=Pseudonocardia spinosispora TaxID=103441 RepID=UPI0003FF21CE|nr:TetR/AcrR family transcriptional regulator [Pseudonocardia spinosispora]
MMVTERADAARNRARVLAAAAELLREREPRSVTMDDVAKAAGVGRATLYRRYPDVRSIAEALLDEHERALQEKLLRGAPPLGPGAPPAERLAAFYAAMVDYLERHLYLVLGVDAGAAQQSVGSYGFWRAHVRSLIAEATDDPDALTDALLAPIAGEVYRYQREHLGLTPERIVAGLALLAHRVLNP